MVELFPAEFAYTGQLSQVAEFKDAPIPGNLPQIRVALEFVGQQAGAPARNDNKGRYWWIWILAQEMFHNCRSQEMKFVAREKVIQPEEKPRVFIIPQEGITQAASQVGQVLGGAFEVSHAGGRRIFKAQIPVSVCLDGIRCKHCMYKSQ